MQADLVIAGAMVRKFLMLLLASLGLAVPAQASGLPTSSAAMAWHTERLHSFPAHATGSEQSGLLGYAARWPSISLTPIPTALAMGEARFSSYSAVAKGLPEWQPSDDTVGFVRAPMREAAISGVAKRLEYGPFRIRGGDTLELIGPTDERSPDLFAQALSEHPGIDRLEMIEGPGTYDDRANLKLGRMIRAAGLATHVPANGSVRSGAVELFFAGATRSIADGAEFAVHSWRDEYGREATDLDADAPQNLTYLQYYRDMGMSAAHAQAFYAFTNSVPHDSALWLESSEMRRWSQPERLTQVAVR